MRAPTIPRPCAWAGLACLALACAPRPEGLEKYVPAPDRARAAVAAALDGWKRGQAPGPIGTEAAPIQVVDTHRPRDRRLSRFEILGNSAREGSRLVTARVTLDEPDESLLVRYQVFGVRPLWVVRQEDLDMLGHWDHPMSETPPPARAE